MKQPIILCVTSPFEMELPLTTGARVWKSFLNGGTNHSAQAATLPYIIRRCEREQRPYKITAYPGKGYFIEPVKDIK